MRTSLYSSIVIMTLGISNGICSERCDNVLSLPGLNVGDVVDLDARQVLSSPVETRPKPNLRLGFIVPSSAYNSGVLIIKTRHQVIDNSQTGRASTIAVSREAYISPCSQSKSVGFYANENVEAERYVDYFHYGFRDSNPNQALNLDGVNADLGVRSIPTFWSKSHVGCVSTAHAAIKPQFLFDDNRQLATTSEKIERQFALFNKPFGTDPAYADPRPYQDYVQMRTTVIPYKKLPNESVCIALRISIPRLATKTDLMIIDADDAYLASSNISFGDPQRAWSILWRQ